MRTCICVTNISNNNNLNRYMHIDHKHILSSCHLCMTNISNNNNSNRYIYIYIDDAFFNRTRLERVGVIGPEPGLLWTSLNALDRRAGPGLLLG